MSSDPYSVLSHAPSYPPFDTTDVSPSPYPLATLAGGEASTGLDGYSTSLTTPQHSSLPLHAGRDPAAEIIDTISPARQESPETKVRLRKACDSCSARKVKCDEQGPPCRACAMLELPCTFDRPTRRRGPPNRHAEALKKRKLESPVNSTLSTPTSPTHAAQTLASFAQHQRLSAESICDFPLLLLLVDDYFTYIHPLIPIPHEPSFRAALQRREDLSNPTFLGLLASMVGALVASFPRKPRQHLEAMGKGNLFPHALTLVNRCHRVTIEARGPGYLDKTLSVYDAAISYLLSLIAAYIYNWKQGKIYLSECLSILRTVGESSSATKAIADPNHLQTYVPCSSANYITQEVSRRLFWVLYVSIKSADQLGTSSIELFLPPSSALDPYPPLPLEIDDAHVFADHVEPQPEELMSELTGFNANVRVYSSYNNLATLEMANRVEDFCDWDRTRRFLRACLNSTKSLLDHLPVELMLQPHLHDGSGLLHRQSSTPAVDFRRSNLFHGLMPKQGEDISLLQRRHVQHGIQRAHIYLSQLGTRSYLVEKYTILSAEQQARDTREGTGNDSFQSPPSPLQIHDLTHGPLTFVSRTGDGEAVGTERTHGQMEEFNNWELEMAQEREIMIRNLLLVLSMINQVDVEPNGTNFINKVRCIASTLLSLPRASSHSDMALRTETHLAAFVDVLVKLERLGPHPSSSTRHVHGPDPGRSHSGNGIAVAGEADDSAVDDERQDFVAAAAAAGDDADGGGNGDGDGDGDGDEDDEERVVRAWADLREQQERFATEGGLAMHGREGLDRWAGRV